MGRRKYSMVVGRRPVLLTRKVEAQAKPWCRWFMPFLKRLGLLRVWPFTYLAPPPPRTVAVGPSEAGTRGKAKRLRKRLRRLGYQDAGFRAAPPVVPAKPSASGNFV